MIQPNSLALWLASHQAAPRKLRHGKGSALIVLARDVLGHEFTLPNSGSSEV